MKTVLMYALTIFILPRLPDYTWHTCRSNARKISPGNTIARVITVQIPAYAPAWKELAL